MLQFLVALIALALAGCGLSAEELLAGPNAVKYLADGRAVDIPSALGELKAVAYPAPEIKLFRLERGVEHEDRNLKVRVRSGVGFEIPADVVVELDTSREGDGLYRVILRAPLPPGEYAFLSQTDMDRWQKYPLKVRIYSVGVD